jgi:PII-like signaling protein
MCDGLLVWYGAGETGMKETEVTMVRIYLHEADAHLSELLEYLHDDSKVRGVTVFRGISGFGVSGEIHSSKLLDMSLDLPVVVEFFDVPEKANEIISELNNKIKPGHIVYWSATINL